MAYSTAKPTKRRIKDKLKRITSAEINTDYKALLIRPIVKNGKPAEWM